MMRPPDPLWDETQSLLDEYFSQFSEEEMQEAIDEEDFNRWLDNHASEELKLYWEYRKWVGDEGQLCDGKGNDILLDEHNCWSWIQDWDVNEDGYCVFKGTDTLIMNYDGTPIKNPVLDKRVADMYECWSDN
ncbi:MAG: hypothetical protein E7233_01780 [Lachnospiraceae bacterium]|nr:hypothetical protein [Lachnospiraceae bacterium]